jgi:hypothetical protein
LRFLLEANHLYEIADLARIATANGMHVLGLEADAGSETDSKTGPRPETPAALELAKEAA